MSRLLSSTVALVSILLLALTVRAQLGANFLGSGIGLSAPYDITTDSANNLYVTSTGNSRVFVLAPNGTLIQTFSHGIQGVNGVGVDSLGNVYIANTTNPGSVTKFSPNGTTLQQFALPTTGTGLQYPWGVRVDANFNVFVSDVVGEQIVKFAPNGTAILFFPQPAASYPNQIALDSAGNLYVGDDSTFQIIKFNGATGAQMQTFGPGLNLTYPDGVYVDASNNVYIADTNNWRVVKLNAAGSVVGYYYVPFAGVGGLKSVTGDSAGNIYVSDVSNNRIIQLTPNYTNPYSVSYIGSGQLSGVYNVAVDSAGNVYACSTSGTPNNIKKFSPTGALLLTFTAPGLFGVNGVAVDNSGYVYTTNTTAQGGNPNAPGGGGVFVFNPSGTLNRTIQLPATATSTGQGLDYPWGVVVDSSYNVYVADTVGEQIVKFSPSGAFLQAYPQPAGSYPNQISVDSAGTLYVADDSTQQVLRISSSGTTQFSYNNFTLTVNGASLQSLGSQLKYPDGAFVDQYGYVYITDSGQNRVLKASPTGAVVAIYASAFNSPKSAVVDAAGNLYVADTSNNRVVKFTNTSYVQPAQPPSTASSSSSSASVAPAGYTSPSSSSSTAAGYVTPTPYVTPAYVTSPTMTPVIVASSSTGGTTPQANGASTVMPAAVLALFVALVSVLLL